MFIFSSHEIGISLSVCVCFAHAHCFPILLLAIRVCIFDLQCYKSFSILNMLIVCFRFCSKHLPFDDVLPSFRFSLVFARSLLTLILLLQLCTFAMYATCESSLIYSEKYSSFQSKPVSMPVYCLCQCVNFV